MRFVKEENKLRFFKVSGFRQIFIKFAQNPQKESCIKHWRLHKPVSYTHLAASLEKQIEDMCRKHDLDFKIEWQESASPFFSEKPYFRNELARAVQDVTGIKPEFSTSGGTSDGRFIRQWCPQVVEFGPVNDRIHKVNERIPTKDIACLSKIYFRILERIFLSEHDGN